MITPMMKYSFLVFHKEYETFLDELRQMGVVHVEVHSLDEATEGRLAEQMRQADYYRRTAMALEALAPETRDSHDAAAGKQAAEDYERLTAEKQKTDAQVLAVEKDIASLTPWGQFDEDALKKIEKAGYKPYFFVCPEKVFSSDWADKYYATVVNNVMGRVYFVAFCPVGEEPDDITAEPVVLPQTSLVDMQMHHDSLKVLQEQQRHNLAKLAVHHLNDVRAAEQQLRQEMVFDKALHGAEGAAGGHLMILDGWVPVDNHEALDQLLNEKGIYFESRPADLTDDAPIKLRNNAFTRMYECLTNMYGMPVYGEFDPTPMIAIFFSIFFAFCIGDAGYGLLLIVLGALLKRKLSPSSASLMNLVMTLGAFTTVGGLVLGTVFGVDIYTNSMTSALHPYMISGKIEGTNYDKQMLLAIIIGVVHISIAMLVKATSTTMRVGFKNALSVWGWFLFVVGSVLTGFFQYLGVVPADCAKYIYMGLAAVSAVGIYLLNDLHRNVFVNIGAGLWDTYNMATGLLGDVLSYIRLYALGLAGAMLGGVFNQLAEMTGSACPAWIGWLPFLLIILGGHTLNLAMSCLSAFVHPLRLTFVEYFKNSGYEGKGERYQPLCATDKKD